MSHNGRIKVENYTALDPKTKGKKGRKKKSTEETDLNTEEKPVLKQEAITDHMPVVKKKRKIDRFNGMPEEEVILKLLPDRLAPNLDILIIGINPGLYAAYIGHHYAGPGNHFWKCLYLSGLVPEPMNCYDDIKVQQFGIGFTNMCARTTRGSADLKREEVLEGGNILIEKLREYKPKIAVFNGKGIYEVFSGNKKFIFGKQPELIEGTDTIAYVMPSSSARCAQLPRAVDKVPFYEALRRLRDHVTGRLPYLDEAEVTFPTLELKNVKKEDPQLKRESEEANGGSDITETQNFGRDLATSQMCRTDLGVKVEQEVKKSSKLLKSKGKEAEDQESGQGVQLVSEFGHGFGGIPHEQDLGVPQGAPALPANILSYANLASFQPASSSSVSVSDTPTLPASCIPNASSSFPSSSLSSLSMLPYDLMSGFYSGAQQFGMVGFPSVVTSQQLSSTAAELSGQQSVQIKSEPVELEVQQ